MPDTVYHKPSSHDALQQEGIPGHKGEPRTIPAHFFAPAPSEIGRVVSAESTLRRGRRGIPLWLQLGTLLFIATAAWIATSYAMQDSSAPAMQSFNFIPWAMTAAIICLGLFFTGFVNVCSYVGTEGVARFKLRGRLGGRVTERTLLFKHAVELRAQQTHRYTNGLYNGTDYDFAWSNSDGRIVYRINGTHWALRKRLPKQGTEYNFALAAESAWSNYYLPQAWQQLSAEGSIGFRIDRNRVVRVGAGFLEFHFGGEPVRVTTDEIASVSLENGTFSFKHQDARWFSRAGKYSFPYGKMANARVFIVALDKLMGYRWS